MSVIATRGQLPEESQVRFRFRSYVHLSMPSLEDWAKVSAPLQPEFQILTFELRAPSLPRRASRPSVSQHSNYVARKTFRISSIHVPPRLPVAFGLLYYGQNYLIYPSAFPPGSRTGNQLSSIRFGFFSYSCSHRLTEVPTPDQFGLQYHDLTLTAQDSTKLRCYLLVQSKDLPHADATEVPFDESTSNDEVCKGSLTGVNDCGALHYARPRRLDKGIITKNCS